MLNDYAAQDAERAAKQNAELIAQLAAAKQGRGYVAVVMGGTKVHAARGIIRGHSGYNHPRALCTPSTPRTYAAVMTDPDHEITCKRCLASL